MSNLYSQWAKGQYMYKGTICRETPHTMRIYSIWDYTPLTDDMSIIIVKLKEDSPIRDDTAGYNPN
jgi:hypothetical protein